jgi:hypothetical protein
MPSSPPIWQVYDVLARNVVFAVNRHGVYGSGPHWRGNAAAASATHVAAIDYRDASVAIWRIDRPDEPIARLTDYSQGARRLMFHGDGKCTVHTCQPPNTWVSLMEVDLASGAAQMAQISHIVDMARTRDGQRTVIVHEKYNTHTLSVSELAAAEEVFSVDVERADGEVAVTPNGATFGAVTHAYPRNDHAESIAQARWRAFGAAKWAKTVKLKGLWQHLVLCDTHAAVMAGHELVVIALANNKTLLSLTFPEWAEAIAISRDGAYVGVGCQDTPRLVHVASGIVTELKHEVPGARQFPRSVCFDEHGTSLFVGFPCGAITRHRVLTGALVTTLHGHDDEVCALTLARRPAVERLARRHVPAVERARLRSCPFGHDAFSDISGVRAARRSRPAACSAAARLPLGTSRIPHSQARARNRTVHPARLPLGTSRETITPLARAPAPSGISASHPP